MNTGAYAKGAEFDITEKQVEQQAQFDIKFQYTDVTLSKEDTQVLNAGPNAVFRLIDGRMTNAYMAAGSAYALSLYLNGARAGFTNLIRGLAEGLNDNSVVSWDNNTYSTYGGLTRGGTIGVALNSTPRSLGRSIEYTDMEEGYGDASWGGTQYEPNIGITTVLGYSYIKEKHQTQQRFNDTQDPAIGFNGLKFNNATILKSRYCPGKDITDTTPSLSNKLAVDFLKKSSAGALTAYPTLATANSETLFWINARIPYICLYVSSDAEYGFGFTGFKPAQGNTKVAGQVLVASALTLAPRYHSQIHGFTG